MHADFAAELVRQHNLDDTFYVFNLGLVAELHSGWADCLPRVTPFYAVKCNPDRGMLAMLAAQGAGFDCASAAEIDLILGLGVPANRIIYAHPCKPLSHIRHAAKVRLLVHCLCSVLLAGACAQQPLPSRARTHWLCIAQVGVNLTTFDTECELHKVAAAHPATGLLLRIRADDMAALHTMGNKYGAEVMDTCNLLSCARSLGLRVTGVSFHVGSGASNPEAFRDAITLARQVRPAQRPELACSCSLHALSCPRPVGQAALHMLSMPADRSPVLQVFDQGAALGFSMTLLDLGGGYSGGQWDAQGRFNLLPVAAAVNAALDQYFPADSGVSIIAEPGRFFAGGVAAALSSQHCQAIRRSLVGQWWLSSRHSLGTSMC